MSWGIRASMASHRRRGLPHSSLGWRHFGHHNLKKALKH